MARVSTGSSVKKPSADRDRSGSGRHNTLSAHPGGRPGAIQHSISKLERDQNGAAVKERLATGQTPSRRSGGAPVRVHPPGANIIFDVEGTLVDCAFQVTESWQRALRDFGREFSSAELHKYSGMDGDDMLRLLLPDAADAEKKRIKIAQGLCYRDIFLPTVTAFPGVTRLLQELKSADYRLALATGAAGDELAAYLELTGIVEYIDAVASGDDPVRGKPHPDLFRLALGRLSARKNALAVGDTPYDAIAAGRVGIKAIGTMSGGFSLRELEDAGCYAVIGRLPQLLEIV
jgi:phosphoglycolate phosphatase-like HAD superfamily hydrolase